MSRPILRERIRCGVMFYISGLSATLSGFHMPQNQSYRGYVLTTWQTFVEQRRCIQDEYTRFIQDLYTRFIQQMDTFFRTAEGR